MEFAAERSTYLPLNSRRPDRPSEPRGAESHSSDSKQPQINRSNSSKQHSKQNRSPEQNLGEAEFWGKDPEPSEQTERELRVFRRVHLQAPSRFMQRMHSIDNSHFRSFDIGHVRAKFPDAPNYLVERLGKAISRRRQYLSYREEYPLDLMYIGPDGQEEAKKTEPMEKAPSQPSTLITPPLPGASYHDKFGECPICFRLISIPSKARWRYVYKLNYVTEDAKLIYRKHICRHLHPYLCTVDGCDTADHIYHSYHAWYEHEIETHYSNTDTNLSTSCMLCGIMLTNFVDLRRHMGGHQRELALFALPSRSLTQSRLSSIIV
jgi:hypothetical protein